MPDSTEFQRRSNVYVLNYGWHDYTAAERYGRLVPVTSGNVDHLHTDRLEHQIQSVLDGMDVDHDYILLSGSPMVNFLAGGFLAQRFPAIKINYLYWEGVFSNYIERFTSFKKKEVPDGNADRGL
jgi:hypothetical protein